MKQFSLKEYLRNSNRKIVTRDGEPVRIIFTNKKISKDNDFPVVALIEQKDGSEDVMCFTEFGMHFINNVKSCYDLFFVPEKQSRWVFLFYSPSKEMIFTSDAYRYKVDAEDAMEKLNGFSLTEIMWEE